MYNKTTLILSARVPGGDITDATSFFFLIQFMEFLSSLDHHAWRERMSDNKNPQKHVGPSMLTLQWTCYLTTPYLYPSTLHTRWRKNIIKRQRNYAKRTQPPFPYYKVFFLYQVWEPESHSCFEMSKCFMEYASVILYGYMRVSLGYHGYILLTSSLVLRYFDWLRLPLLPLLPPMCFKFKLRATHTWVIAVPIAVSCKYSWLINNPHCILITETLTHIHSLPQFSVI